MGGSASCLNHLSASPLCRRNRIKCKVIKVEAQKPTKGIKRCKYCNCQYEECRIRKSNCAIGISEKVRSVKCGTDSESIYIENSQFPFRRPKTLPVKPFITKSDANPSRNENFTSLGSDFAPKPIYGFYPYKHLQNLTISEPTTFPRSQTEQPASIEEMQRSVSYNHGMTNKAGYLLPNRTVETLRNTESYQFFNNDTYPPERLTNHIVEARAAKRQRPPTPWYPSSRTEDYLVASSLLEAEKGKVLHMTRH